MKSTTTKFRKIIFKEQSEEKWFPPDQYSILSNTFGETINKYLNLEQSGEKRISIRNIVTEIMDKLSGKIDPDIFLTFLLSREIDNVITEYFKSRVINNFMRHFSELLCPSGKEDECSSCDKRDSCKVYMSKLVGGDKAEIKH